MEQTIYDAANKLYKVDGYFNPFAECGRECAVRARDIIRKEFKPGLPIGYIFDQGDKGKGMLIDMMERSELSAPAFKRSRPDRKNPNRDKEDPPAIQLQTCDLLAWEIRRGMNDQKQGKRLRRSLMSFLQMENVSWKECTYHDMARVIRSIGIPRRQHD